MSYLSPVISRDWKKPKGNCCKSFITTRLMFSYFRLIEQCCLEYNVDMKPCENVSKFLEKVDEFKETIGKPL